MSQQWGGPYNIAPYPDEFQFNEIGWQDQITVTVKYNLALLPGPGRLLARYIAGIGGQQGSRNQRLQRRLHLSAYAPRPRSATRARNR